MFAEPGVLKDVGLRECVAVEEEEMAKALIGLKGEVGDFKGSCGGSRDEGHVHNWQITMVFIPIFR